MRARLDRERADAERRAHFMKCPKCGADLHETEFHHLKVDRCPDCSGMWFDAGEIRMMDQVKEHRVADFIRDLFKGLPGK
jgi:Zn-finger nucleic acid-binding protein